MYLFRYRYQGATSATQHKLCVMPLKTNVVIYCVGPSILCGTVHHVAHMMTPLSSMHGYMLLHLRYISHVCHESLL